MSHTSRFIDPSGFLWQVMEVGASEALAAPIDRSNTPALYFCSRGCTMVLREFPADWLSMDWAGLERLRLRATVLSSDVTRLPAAPHAGRPGFLSAEA